MPNPCVVEVAPHPEVIQGWVLKLWSGERPDRPVLRRGDGCFITSIQRLSAELATEERGGATVDVVRFVHTGFEQDHVYAYGGDTGYTEEEMRKWAGQDYNRRCE